MGAEPVAVTDLYDHLAENGYHYGPAFQGLKAAWRCGDEGFAEVALPEELAHLADRHTVHPALLDAALHAIPLTAPPGGAGRRRPRTVSGCRSPGEGSICTPRVPPRCGCV
ncbi:polyketide synthase dehydratase domain-containing protein [Streptomyces sp. M19]